MRRAREALTRGLILALAAAVLAAGCRERDPAADVTAAWTIDPGPPSAASETIARITLQDARQQPVRGAALRLEAHMSHPGMAPVTASLTESHDGVYETRMTFSMAGDWVLVVSGTLADGRRILRQLEVAGVRPAG